MRLPVEEADDEGADWFKEELWEGALALEDGAVWPEGTLGSAIGTDATTKSTKASFVMIPRLYAFTTTGIPIDDMMMDQNTVWPTEMN